MNTIEHFCINFHLPILPAVLLAQHYLVLVKKLVSTAESDKDVKLYHTT